MKNPLVVIAATVLATLVGGCSASPPTAPPPTAPLPSKVITSKGTLDLHGADASEPLTNADGSSGVVYNHFVDLTLATGEKVCSGTNGYEDVAWNAQINVYDPAGTVIGVANLGKGHLIPDSTDPTVGTCSFDFTATNIPKRDLYLFELGKRGRVTMTAADVAAGVALTLG